MSNFSFILDETNNSFLNLLDGNAFLKIAIAVLFFFLGVVVALLLFKYNKKVNTTVITIVKEKEPEPIKEEPVKEEPVKEEVKEEPKEEVKEEPVKEEPKEETVATEEVVPVVGDLKKKGKKKPKIPFANKVLKSTKLEQVFFNDLYNEFISYRNVHARVSDKGTSFRFGKVLIAKMTYRGKTMKLHLALDVNKFDQKRYFQQDLKDVKSYVEVPFAVKLKSERSYNRSYELISALAEKNDIQKKTRYESVDAIALLKEIKKKK